MKFWQPVYLPWLIGAVVLGGQTARADQFCVACDGPPATYRCQPLSGPDGVPPAQSVGQLLCIKELAKSGGHLSCSVDSSDNQGCAGEVVTVFPPEGEVLPQAPVHAGQKPGDLGVEQEWEAQLQPEEKKNKEPETVAEMAEDTAEASKQGLKKAGEAVSSAGKVVVDSAKTAGKTIGKAAESAGDTIKKTGGAVGNAAKKTWDCVTSLFSDC